MENTLLFTLMPMSPAATRIVKANRRFRDMQVGTESLSFRAGHKSRFPGRLLSIGRLEALNDVILPESGYAQLQCSFLLVPTGELMLEDATTGHHTYISWHDERGQQDKYSLQGDPRRRVIPQANAKSIIIKLGQNVTFRFCWRVSMKPNDVEDTRKKLVNLALANAAPGSGVMLSVPRDPNLDPTAYEVRTVNTPAVPKEYDGRPLRQVHVYMKLRSGGFRTVSKAVDLATGSLWAVKEYRKPDNSAVDEDWKLPFKHEVEKLTSLCHPNIVRLEHHQGWSLGRPVQIFLPLCKGSVEDLTTLHQCMRPSHNAKIWVPRFIDQVLSALAFIHRNGMIHRDIKPGNILYDDLPGDSGRTFYISDFGLATSKESLGGLIGGCLPYMAPETTRNGECTNASDVYSFGVILLEVLGKYCVHERKMAVQDWREKLRVCGVRDYRDYRDNKPTHALIPKAQVGHSRIQSLLDYGVVRPAIRRILEQDERRRATAVDARRDLLVCYPLAPVPVPLKRRPTGRAMDIRIRAR